MEGALGVIAEGALADLVMLDIEKPHWYPRNDLTAALIYSAKAGDVDTVFIDGAEIVSGGRIAELDLERVMQDAEKTTERITRASAARS